MCGIGVHAVWKEDHYWNEDNLQLIRNALACSIERRGPSLPRSHLDWPDCNCNIYMCASVLHMRGHTLTPQPLARIDQDQSLAFMWNGECYKCSDPLSHFDSARGVDSCSSSDTQFVLQHILHHAFPTKQDTLELIAQAMSYIHGEYAFVLSVYPEVIYFARDPWGRRSLLLTCTPSHESAFHIFNNEKGDSYTISSLVLSSVGWSPFFLTSQTDPHATTEHDIHSIMQAATVQEVIPGRVYQFNVSTRKLSYVNIPTCHSCSSDQYAVSIPCPFEVAPNTTTEHSQIPSTLPTATIQASDQLLNLLHWAVRRRVVNLSSCTSHLSSRVAVLFSGGLDSVILAALSHFHIPMDETIDLINVSFASSAKLDMNIEQSNNSPNAGSLDTFESPDRIAAIQSFHELKKLWPQRKWRLILANIRYQEVLEWETRIRALIHPLVSTMDFNIGTAMWFASRAKGIVYQGNGDDDFGASSSSMTTSNAPIVLVGIGADEQMAGYGRHRSVYKRGGYDALRSELAMEKDRLWTRNLGRDDRIIADHGKEARFPYLDDDIVNYLNHLDMEEVCDMTKPPGSGDKAILRLAAYKLGLRSCALLAKRAIQFGSRIAHVSDVQRFGSRQKAKGWKTIN